MQKLTLPRLRGMVARSNDLEASEVQVSWVQKPRTVKYPTGLVGKVAVIQVAAPGFRTREMRVLADEHGTMVR